MCESGIKLLADTNDKLRLVERTEVRLARPTGHGKF